MTPATFDQRGSDITTAVPHCRATYERSVADNIDAILENPAVARANQAASTDMPQGSVGYSQRFSDYTVLQQHVLFFDRDADGVIYPWDTYIGFRELGFSILFSLFSGLFINFGFSYPSHLVRSFLPDPFLGVYVQGIHKAKHGSDSGVYDHEGRFVPQKFEEIFARWDKDGKGSLSLRQVFDLIHGNRVWADPFGWIAGIFEFITTWLLVQRGGRVSKEDLRQIYDGSIFWRIRDDIRSGKG